MAEGTVKTMSWSHQTPEQVMDLVPVRPLGDDEAAIKEMGVETAAGIIPETQGMNGD